MLAKRLGVFETREKPKYVTSLAFLNTGDLLCGDSNGTLSMWYRGGNTVAHRVKGAHVGSVFSILVQNNGTIITAGKDGKVQEWDSSLNPTSNSLKVILTTIFLLLMFHIYSYGCSILCYRPALEIVV